MLKWFKKLQVEVLEEVLEPDPPELAFRNNRHGTFAEAHIVSTFQMKTRGALVNLSETGACLRFRSLSGVQIGDELDICVPLKKINRKASVIWRDQHEIGVEFYDTMIRTKIAHLQEADA